VDLGISLKRATFFYNSDVSGEKMCLVAPSPAAEGSAVETLKTKSFSFKH